MDADESTRSRKNSYEYQEETGSSWALLLPALRHLFSRKGFIRRRGGIEADSEEKCRRMRDLMVAGYDRSGVNANPGHHLVSLVELAIIRR
jgi:hypothetical protein